MRVGAAMLDRLEELSLRLPWRMNGPCQPHDPPSTRQPSRKCPSRDEPTLRGVATATERNVIRHAPLVRSCLRRPGSVMRYRTFTRTNPGPSRRAPRFVAVQARPYREGRQHFGVAKLPPGSATGIGKGSLAHEGVRRKRTCRPSPHRRRSDRVRVETALVMRAREAGRGVFKAVVEALWCRLHLLTGSAGKR